MDLNLDQGLANYFSYHVEIPRTGFVTNLIYAVTAYKINYKLDKEYSKKMIDRHPFKKQIYEYFLLKDKESIENLSKKIRKSLSAYKKNKILYQSKFFIMISNILDLRIIIISQGSTKTYGCQTDLSLAAFIYKKVNQYFILYPNRLIQNPDQIIDDIKFEFKHVNSCGHLISEKNPNPVNKISYIPCNLCKKKKHRSKHPKPKADLFEQTCITCKKIFKSESKSENCSKCLRSQEEARKNYKKNENKCVKCLLLEVENPLSDLCKICSELSKEPAEIHFVAEGLKEKQDTIESDNSFDLNPEEIIFSDDIFDKNNLDINDLLKTQENPIHNNSPRTQTKISMKTHPNFNHLSQVFNFPMIQPKIQMIIKSFLSIGDHFKILSTFPINPRKDLIFSLLQDLVRQLKIVKLVDIRRILVEEITLISENYLENSVYLAFYLSFRILKVTSNQTIICGPKFSSSKFFEVFNHESNKAYFVNVTRDPWIDPPLNAFPYETKQVNQIKNSFHPIEKKPEIVFSCGCRYLLEDLFQLEFSEIKKKFSDNCKHFEKIKQVEVRMLRDFYPKYHEGCCKCNKKNGIFNQCSKCKAKFCADECLVSEIFNIQNFEDSFCMICGNKVRGNNENSLEISIEGYDEVRFDQSVNFFHRQGLDVDDYQNLWNFRK